MQKVDIPVLSFPVPLFSWRRVMKPDLMIGNELDNVLDVLRGIHNRLSLYLYESSMHPEDTYFLYIVTGKRYKEIKLIKKYYYLMKREVNKFYKKYKRSK